MFINDLLRHCAPKLYLTVLMNYFYHCPNTLMDLNNLRSLNKRNLSRQKSAKWLSCLSFRFFWTKAFKIESTVCFSLFDSNLSCLPVNLANLLWKSCFILVIWWANWRLSSFCLISSSSWYYLELLSDLISFKVGASPVLRSQLAIASNMESAIRIGDMFFFSALFKLI